MDLENWYRNARKGLRSGNLKAAAQWCQRILEARPGHAGALLVAAQVRLRQGDPQGGLRLLQQAVAADPDNAEIHAAAGQALWEAGLADPAEAALARALRLDPGRTEAHRLLGTLYRAQGLYSRALPHVRQAAEQSAGDAAAWEELGALLEQTGRSAEAAEAFARALTRKPAARELLLQRAAALEAAGDADGQAAAFAECLRRIRPAAEAHRRVAAIHSRLHRHDLSARHHRAALELEPGDWKTTYNLGNDLLGLGDFAGSLEAYRAVLRVRPDQYEPWANLLFTTCFDPGTSPEALLAVHKEWGDGLLARVGAGAVRHRNPPDPERPLRVGYLSPDFRDHPVSVFLSSAVAFHHRDRFETFCYSSNPKEDPVTRAFRQVVPHWREVSGMDDRRLAEGIRADGIDILVELAGHTKGNRLPVLALRPAPVQVSYLGYPATTGLATVDYRLTDALCNPPETQAWYCERLVPIEGGFCCYLPRPDAPDPGRLPAARNGHVTFGSLLNPKKVGEPVVALWARVLKEVPDARLLLFRNTLAAPATRARYVEAFGRHGIGPERLDLRWERRHPNYMAVYRDIDVALDTLPFAGHTLTCEGLWMGVPTVTLMGRDFAGRMGASVLHMAGLEGFTARTEDEFVRIAAGWAGRPQELARLRQGLRRQVERSRLCDATAFTRALEAAYRGMWRNWCETRRP